MKIFERNLGQRPYPGVVLVEARDVVKLAAAGIQKSDSVLDRDLLQRLETVGDEARAHHIHSSDLVLAQLGHDFDGVWLEPFRASEAGLKRDNILVRFECERFGQQACRFMTLAVIGVSLIQGEARHAMEAHHQAVATAACLPVVPDALRQGLDVPGVIVEMPYHTQCWHVAHVG